MEFASNLDLKRQDKMEKELAHQTGVRVKDIRVQLSEQLKCLDDRLEIQQSIVSEVQDIFRRRAEIESAYSRDLDKLTKYINNRHKEHKQRRDGWPLFSSTAVWEQLVAQTKKNSRDHASLADIYSNHVVGRCQEINEDLQRIFRKCREIGLEVHEEVLKVLHELYTAMKTHHAYQSEFRQAENKLQVVEKQRLKLQNSIPEEKRLKSRKYRLIEKEYSKRKQKYDDAKINASKAQNEYLLSMDSANSSVQKYFVDDLSDLIDCMDFGFHQSLTRAIMMHCSAKEQLRRSLQRDIDQMNKTLTGLDSRLDKQRFFESKNATFMIPKKFEFTQYNNKDPNNKQQQQQQQPPPPPSEEKFVVHKAVLDELRTRKEKIKERLMAVKAESEEIWKSMETAERTLSEMVDANDWDTTRFFVEEDRNSCREPEAVTLKLKMDRHDTETFYMNKFREYVLNSNRVARLQAKYDHICITLGDQTSQPTEGILTLTRRPNSARRRRIGKTPKKGQPKLFGGSLEEFLEESNEDIPLIIRSCVRVINLYGLHHHGIFRISGAQVEINNFRDAFERGEDPLAEMNDASDINSVCGVFKLFLRELREPIFPIQYFDQFVELAQLESKHEFVVKVRELVNTWPRPIFIVMRYLFAFLNHLSEFSDENMMDPYNLAICFGPTLVPIPEERDQVQYQNLVNELIKNFIVFHEDIFSADIPGMRYEKYMTAEPLDDMADSPNDNNETNEATEDDSVFTEDTEKDDFPDLSLDLFGKSSEPLEAQALYEFKARSSREVNFHKGDTVILYKQVSNDWWRGSVNGTEGLIPDKYITLRIRGEDERSCLEEPPSNNRHRSSSSTTTNTSDGHSPLAPLATSTTSTLTSATTAATAPRSSSITSESTTEPGLEQQQQQQPSSSVTTTTVVTLTADDEDSTMPDPVVSSSISHVMHVSGSASGEGDGNTSSEGRVSNNNPSSSQDSLADSTGSNQELQRKLNSTLAEVDAITEEIVKRKTTTTTTTTAIASKNNGARPKITEQRGGPVLRQTSWASRDQKKEEEAEEAEEFRTFSANRRLWERLSTQGETTPPIINLSSPSSQRPSSSAKQTPDLVLDLPMSASPSASSSSSSSAIPSPSTSTQAPIPKPRTKDVPPVAPTSSSSPKAKKN